MADSHPRSRPRWPLLAGLAWLGVLAGASVATLALARSDTLAEVGPRMLTAHYAAFMSQTFAYHAALAMLPAIALGLLARRRRLALAAALVLALGAAPELPGLWPHRSPAGSGEVLKIMSINLMYGHSDAGLLLEQIGAESPDVLVFQEWTPQAERSLGGELRTVYPHPIEQPRDDAFGQAVLCKRALVGTPRTFPPVPGFAEPQITFTIIHDRRPLQITNVHLLPPVGRTYFQHQRAGAARLAAWLGDTARDDRSDLLLGDFNTARRTGTLSGLRAAGLSEAQSQAGWWRGSTWPRTGVLRWAPGIRLDHALLRDTLECVEARTGEDFGSDHRPVIVRVRWR
ncbi:MAG TPA: endonuclease/exonuclease/phosphatase family protein [Phycisphaerales bacterium]|nr:endonuclease/exonuclease/phosphatase family protein [Phycisphaerales bacterium]